jgi:hypothetical protein
MSNAQLASVGSVVAGIALVAWAATRPLPGEKQADAAAETVA